MKRQEPGDEPAPFWEDRAFLRHDAAVPMRPRRSAAATHGTARLAGPDDLAPLLRPSGEPHDTTLAGISPLVADLADGRLAPLFARTLHLPAELLDRHLLLVGQTGCGKTQRAILPLIASQLRDPARSLVVFDVKGELYEPLHELALAAGRADADVLRLDLTDPGRTIGWNPIAADADATSTFDVAHQVCSATERRAANDSAFWLQTSVDVVAGILGALAADPTESPTLARVRELLNLPWSGFRDWLARHADAPSLRRFADFVETGSHNAHTALADASNRLLVYLDRALAAVTSHDELDLGALVDRPTVLVIAAPESHIERLRPLFNLLVQQVIDTLLRRADRMPQCRLPRPVTLFLDEFASVLGRLPELEVRLNTLRGRRVSLIAAVQGLAQIEHVYATAAGPLLAGFGSKVFFANLEVQDAVYASRLAGVTTVDDEQIHERWDDARGMFVPATRTRLPVGRPLLLPGELTHPLAHFEFGLLSTWFLAELPPFQAWTTPAHRSPELGPVLRRARAGELADRGRRDWPLEAPTGPTAPTAGAERNLAQRMRMLEKALRLDGASRRAQARWEAWCATEAGDLRSVVDFARQLRARDIDIDGWSLACERAATTSARAVLHFLDFEAERDRHRRRPRNTGWLPFGDAETEPATDGGEDSAPELPF